MPATPSTMGPHQLAALVDGWRGAGPGTLPQRLARALRSLVTSGLIPPGTTLPPERSAAARLGVSRSTMAAAYDALRLSDVLTSRQGSGTRVPAAAADHARAATAASVVLTGRGTINLGASVAPDATHLPQMSLDTARLCSVDPSHGYSPAGLPVLRAAIADRHRGHGLPTRAEQIHVTNGAQHALDLAVAACATKGGTVAIEDPTYIGVHDVLAAHRLRSLALAPTDFDDDPDGVVARCRAARVGLVVLVPAVHSPTGRVRSPAELERLAVLLDRIGVPVVEDNTVAELAFAEPRPPSLAALCRHAPVVSVESTSKVAWGGLRVGWLRGAVELIDQTVTAREAVDYGSSVPSQLLALQLLEQYDDVVAHRRATLSRAAALFTDFLAARLPEWTFVPPDGGLSVWVRTGVDADLLARRALLHGVTVAPGSTASRGAGGRAHLRLCFDRPPLELDAATMGLRRAHDDCVSSGS